MGGLIKDSLGVYSKAKTELCVSPNEVWIRAQLDNSLSYDELRSRMKQDPVFLIASNGFKV